MLAVAVIGGGGDANAQDLAAPEHARPAASGFITVWPFGAVPLHAR